MKRKNLLKVIAAATLGGTVAFGLALTGCGHSHTFDTEKWGGKDAEGHWHLSTCGHDDEKGDFEAHEYGTDGKAQYCIDCNFENPDYVAPQATQLSAPVISLNGAEISWTAVDHATGYEIYRDGTKVTSVTVLKYTATDTEAGNYVYTVKAISSDTANYSTSAASNSVTYTVTPKTVEYTITLNAHGGTLTGDATVKTVDDGVLATLPAAPTNADTAWTFNGWYTAETGGDKITTETKFTQDTTIHAQWRATDGLYDADGKVIEALEYVAPGDTALNQYGASGIILSAGDTFTIKIEGTTLSHNEGSLELWLANGCHGIDFNQSAGTFTVKAGDDRAFQIYAKYYEDNTPCWSIYITDGLEDELVVGGAYLVGTGWTGDGWDISADNYIHPENGLTVTLAATAAFKITDCVEGGDNGRGWSYNNPSFYKVKDDAEGYLNFANVGAAGNVKVLAAGEYTITVDNTGATPVFVFTPAEGLEPSIPTEPEFVTGGAYLVGTGFAGSDLWAVNKDYYIDPEVGLKVTFEKNASIQITDCTNGTTGAAGWSYKSESYFTVVDGDAYISFSGGNGTVNTAGEYTITVGGTVDNPVFTFTHAADLQPDDVVVERATHYFIKGPAAGGWGVAASDDTELKETAAGSGVYTMTIDLTEGEFMFYSLDVNVDDPTDKINGKAEIKADKIGEGKDYVSGTTGNITAKAAGTYTFTYTASTQKLDVQFVPSAVAPVERITHIYIKGAAVPSVGWSAPANETYELKAKDGADGVYEMEIDLIAGAFMFYSKAVNSEDATDIIDGTVEIKTGKVDEDSLELITSTGNEDISVAKAGKYKFTYNSETDKLTIVLLEEAAPVETVLHYYIKGTAVPSVGWGAPANETYELKAKDGADGVYEMQIDLVAGEFMFYSKNVNAETGAVIGDGSEYIMNDKVDEASQSLITSTGGGNIILADAGTYKFTYNSETQKLSIEVVEEV